MVKHLRLGTAPQHFVSHLLLTFCLYIGAGYIGLTLTFAQENTSPFWPPTGIAICALLFFGYRVWPAIFAGVIVVNLLATGFTHAMPSLLIAIGNTLEAISAVWLIHYFDLASKPFSTISNTFKFLFAITIPGSLISATVGVVTLTTFLGVPTEAFNYLWITWMTGDAMGALTIVPLVLSWHQHHHPWRVRQTLELILLATMGVILSALIFHDWLPKDYSNAMTFLVVLPITWAAFRFGCRGATILTLIVTLLATIGTVNGTGPYTNASINTALLLLQSFIASIAIISLSLAVLSEYQQEHEALLFEHNQKLTSKVQQQHVAQETVEDAFSKLHDENNFILSASTDGLVVINKAGKIVRASAAFCRMLQYSDSVLQHQPLSAFLITQQPFQLQPAIANTNTEALTRHEVQMQAQSGKIVTVDVNMSRLVGPQNNPYYYLYTHDITRKKKAEHTIKSLATRSSLVGQEAQFFYQCLTDVASFYGAKYAFIGLLTDKSPPTLQTFSGYANGECLEAFECNLQGTPCWDVISKATSMLNTQVQINYPNIDMLQELGIASYFGVPLFDRDKKLIGNVSIMDTKPLDIEPWEEQILQLLASRTSSELEHKKAMDEIESINTKLAWHSSHDSLTGLLNRQMFHLQLSSALSELERNNTPTHLLYCDVDEFHSINHTIGQPAGDYLLKQVAIRLKSQLDNKAVISRLGSDKFGIILTNSTLTETNQLAKRMTGIIEQSNFHWLGHDIHTSISIGIVPQSQLQNGAEAAILTAEIACQTAKLKGKNQVATLPEVQNITPLERTNNG